MAPPRYLIAAALALTFATAGCESDETDVEVGPPVEDADPMMMSEAAPAAPAVLPPADQAVEDFMAKRFVRCGDSRFTPHGLGGFTEWRGLSHEVSSVPLTEADRLNGVEFVREVRFTFTAQRGYGLPTRAWSPWSPPDRVVQEMARLGGTTQLPYVPVRIFTRDGQTIAQRGSGIMESTEVVDDLPEVDCSDIPGAARPSSSRSSAPTTPAAPAASANSARGDDTQMRQGRESDLVFRRGTSSATVEGVVQGNEVQDYLFTARGGQNIRVNLAAESEADVTLTNGDGGRTLSEADGNDIEFRLPYSGRYRIQVMQPYSSTGANRFSLYVEII